MELKDAIILAKRHVLDLCADEDVANLGLEAVDFDDQAQEWFVTVGYSRPREEPGDTRAGLESSSVPRRVSKVVRISDSTEQILPVENREAQT